MASQGVRDSHELVCSNIAESDELHFTGQSAEEAEDFIQAVNKRAYAAGKQKDNAWIAEFACPFFSKKALRWYDGLDEATQNDWKLLRSAILAEFTAAPPVPSPLPSPALAVVSPSSPHIPRDPPPPATTMIGRVRVHDEEPAVRGYLTVPATGIGLGNVCKNINDASVLELDISRSTLKVQGETDYLVIKADDRNGSFSEESTGFLVSKLADTKFIHIPADAARFLTCYLGFKSATLYFEPISRSIAVDGDYMCDEVGRQEGIVWRIIRAAIGGLRASEQPGPTSLISP
ncbi:hypothetical protein FS837_012805 [Tulasnella sp. UAMH 9824]|nr:hypothetical protein FS837_012805 [Tulasnella sp. UAMH 9824]